MWPYLVRRLIAAIFVLIGVSLVVFLVLHLTPGDPAQVLLGPRATPDDLARLRQELGLDRPRSEEHTSELQSPCNLVCRLLLEKKKKKHNNTYATLPISNHESLSLLD